MPQAQWKKGLKESFRRALNTQLKRYHYEIVESRQLYDWQKAPRTGPSYRRSELPEEARQYLQLDNPRLAELNARYAAFSKEVTTPLVWRDGYVRPEDILYFRGDNAYVWQLRGPNMNAMAYALTTFYVRSIDRFRLLDRLDEDSAFGNFTFRIDDKVVSRDLLDSILEIYFLEKHLGLSNARDMTLLDIGAGYGRLAHRMVTALPGIRNYLCTDAVAASTFISEYYLRYRGVDGKARVVPLDELKATLNDTPVSLALNIHSFSECTLAAIDWWLSFLEERGVSHLMIVPNAGNHGGERLLTNDGRDFGEVIKRHGYEMMVKAPKYGDPLVQKYAINPTYHYLYVRH